jgi:tetratricopeptide (TPR) repeat protein
MTTSISPLHCSRGSTFLLRFASLVIVLAVAPATALADKKAEAKAHVAKATKAHKEGHFEMARVELEAAYALDPRPDLLFAIGQVYAKLGECGEATTYFKRFVVTQKDPQVAKVIDQAIAACKPSPVPAANPSPPDSSPRPDNPAPPANTPTPATDTPAPFAQTKPAPAQSDARQRSPWYKGQARRRARPRWRRRDGHRDRGVSRRAVRPRRRGGQDHHDDPR